MGQVFYAVKGAWDDPGVEVTDSQSFADVSTRTGCLSQEQTAFSDIDPFFYRQLN